jgi:large subunit ribosomal protein L26e
VHREKTNGATVPIGVHPSSVIVTKIKIDKDRQALLDRKARTSAKKDETMAEAVR